MKIIDSVWFDKIGIVKIDNGFETKWYIGMAGGHNKELDEKRIALAGMPVHPKLLQGFFKSLRDEKKEEENRLKEEKRTELFNKLKEQQNDNPTNDTTIM